MTSVSVHEAKTHLSRLLREIEAGREVEITRRNRVVARIVPPVGPKPGRRIGLLKGKIAIDERFFEPLPDDELAAWEGD
jgi:prevent-host-death family protein